jgi:hypothetical protein
MIRVRNTELFVSVSSEAQDQCGAMFIISFSFFVFLFLSHSSDPSASTTGTGSACRMAQYRRRSVSKAV